jgi:uncharacterized protein (DUF433 family)
MSIPEELQEVLTSTPDTLGGALRFAGTRVAVSTLLDHIEFGYSLEEFLQTFPTVSRKQAQAVLAWISKESRPTLGLVTGL